MSDFGFFTKKGEDTARVLVSGICLDVSSDVVTRRQALDRLVDAMERVGALDEGAEDQDVLGRVIGGVNAVFAEAGFVPVDLQSYRGHAAHWRLTGAPVDAGSIPLRVARASAASGALTDALVAATAAGLSIQFTEGDPFVTGVEEGTGLLVCLLPPSDACWNDERWQVSVLVRGNEGSQYLDFLMAGEAPEARIATLLGADVPVEALNRVNASVFGLNTTLAELGEGSRLDLGASADGLSGPTLSWDGVDVSPGAAVERVTRGRSRMVPLSEDAFISTPGGFGR